MEPPFFAEAAPTLEQCFHPSVFDLALDELKREMSNEQHQYSNLLQTTVVQLSSLVMNLKKLVLSDSINEGGRCFIPDVICLSPNYPNNMTAVRFVLIFIAKESINLIFYIHFRASHLLLSRIG